MKKSILLTEGKDDAIVIANLCMQHNIDKSLFDIPERNSTNSGKTNVLKEFSLYIDEIASTYKTVGLVVDADTNIDTTWQAIQSIIDKSGAYPDISTTESSNGFIIEPKSSRHPRIGIWIMPDNTSGGMLEDFVAQLTHDNDLLMHEAEKALQTLEAKKLNEYKPVHRAKSKIHTYLAWKDEPGKPMGQAIKAKQLNSNTKMAEMFVGWVKKLFDINQN